MPIIKENVERSYSDLFLYRILSNVIPSKRKEVLKDVISALNELKEHVSNLKSKPKPIRIGFKSIGRSDLDLTILKKVSLYSSYIDGDLYIKHNVLETLKDVVDTDLESFSVVFYCRRRKMDWSVVICKRYNKKYLKKLDMVNFIDRVISYFDFISTTEESLNKFMNNNQKLYN